MQGKGEKHKPIIQCLKERKKAEPADLLASCGMNPDTCLNSSSLALPQSLQAAQSRHRQAGVSWLYPTY